MNIKDLKDFYTNKKVLITGHTGFKGAWLTQMLLDLGANISGISLNPYKSSLFEILELNEYINDNRVNILNLKRCQTIIQKFKPEIIFHLAAQPLVKLSYLNPLLTHNTNYIGTANILNLLSQNQFIKSAVFITTDKVYKNDEFGFPFKESDPLGGFDPYSASKAASEILIESWRKSFIDLRIQGLATARAGNVVGGGDWASDRIIPDLFRAYYNNNDLLLRNPNAVRPWQHVMEPLLGYLQLAKKLYEQPLNYSKSYNFGPYPDDELTVKELIELIMKNISFDKNKIKLSTQTFHEAKVLKLDISLATNELDWKPILNSYESIELTVNWYKNFKSNRIRKFTIQQINNYFNEFN